MRQPGQGQAGVAEEEEIDSRIRNGGVGIARRQLQPQEVRPAFVAGAQINLQNCISVIRTKTTSWSGERTDDGEEVSSTWWPEIKICIFVVRLRSRIPLGSYLSFIIHLADEEYPPCKKGNLLAGGRIHTGCGHQNIL